MRCTRVEFKGFKRLADTGTSIHGPLTAVVGLNEAGKSSLLAALRWLSSGGALPTTSANRTRPPGEDTLVVRAFMQLSEGDLDAIADIPMEVKPKFLVYGRYADGRATYQLQPRPTRVSKAFSSAASQLATTKKRLASQFDSVEDTDDDEDAGETPQPGEWAEAVSQALSRPNSVWREHEQDALLRLGEWLNQVPSGRATQPRNARLSALLREVHSIVDSEHPSVEAGTKLWRRVPRFILFEEANRVLESVHELSSDELREEPPPALRDLLLIAGVGLDDLWGHIQASDTTSRETLLEHGNERLLRFFSAAWNQSNITVRLNVSGSRLELLVKDLREMGEVTNIEERSDGLRSFVALAAFVASGGYAVPPILLIDEAETHLHLNAQADMVGVLLKSLDATQVIYTTHSPGCLPSDLGTSIRLVSRDREVGDASILRHDFWNSPEPGFAPLLFAMGAEAAAFSMCRQAVLSEGPTDMILLPTLIRKAVGGDDLTYQIAPGLATLRSSALPANNVASNVLYLADGDDEGQGYAEKLREAGVPRTRVFNLPKGQAVEDLVLRTDYLDAVNGLLDAMGAKRRVTAPDLAGELTVAKALETWGAANKVRLPSKVDIAYALLERDSLELTAAAARALVKIHRAVLSAFGNQNV